MKLGKMNNRRNAAPSERMKYVWNRVSVSYFFVKNNNTHIVCTYPRKYDIITDRCIHFYRGGNMEQTDQMDLDSILETRQQYMDVLAYLYRGLSAIRRFEGMSRDINTDIVNCSNEIKSQQGRINNANRILAANDKRWLIRKRKATWRQMRSRVS